MEIVIDVNEVLPHISMASGIISGKNVVPILDFLHFNAYNDGKMEAMGSNGETWITSPFQAKQVNLDGLESFSFCFESNLFIQALRNLANKELSMVFDMEKKSVICSYTEGVITMPYYGVDEYPLPTSVDGDVVKVKAQTMCYAITKAKGATANDSLRPQLNGIHFEFKENKMDVVATNAHRMVLFVEHNIGFEGNIEMTLPLTALDLVSDCALKCEKDENATIVISQVNAKFMFPNGMVVTTRKIEGKYPNYSSVIPQEWHDEAYLNKQETISALKRVIPMGNVATGLVVLEYNESRKQSFTILAEDLDFAHSAQEDVRCVDYNGDTFKIGFNGSYLLQALQAFDCEQVMMRMSGASKGVLITPVDVETGFVYLLMPAVVQ